MRVLSFCLAIGLVACSSSSGSSSPADGGTGADSSLGDATGDDGAGADASDDGAATDAATVCNLMAPLDAGTAPDAGTDAGSGEAGATDASVSCYGACVAGNPSAYARFAAHQLSECGCLANGPCYASCHAATTWDPASSCGQCLASQTAEGLASTCTLAAAADCSNEASCTAFQTCAGMCP